MQTRGDTCAPIGVWRRLQEHVCACCTWPTIHSVKRTYKRSTFKLESKGSAEILGVEKFGRFLVTSTEKLNENFYNHCLFVENKYNIYILRKTIRYGIFIHSPHFHYFSFNCHLESPFSVQVLVIQFRNWFLFLYMPPITCPLMQCLFVIIFYCDVLMALSTPCSPTDFSYQHPDNTFRHSDIRGRLLISSPEKLIKDIQSKCSSHIYQRLTYVLFVICMR